MAGESKTTKKYEKPKTGIPNLCMDNMKAPLCSSSSVPTSPVGLRKSSSVRRHNCLCSPTTHAGSFRCRYHRNSGLMRNSISVGAKLSELAGNDNVSRIQLIAAHGQGSSS